ncbi:hypothetical protein M3M39_01385 [Fructilactobacillus hinvesii]|uniref:GP-PDE domain-containing protein n=1 Tax=Fructilactobacillus hinvesii TaxID=2940300 RepID=A0ABY5BSR8_9LACO|nr:glycerophosphodiester phosphodiesterase family protein [Fructilactobacillus hinvesii]USS88164.1 hypothetical protein M3M39_01385 [Fructilactobacillus hinvesii]
MGKIIYAHRFQVVRIPTVEQLVQTLNQHQLNVNFELKGTTDPHAQELVSKLVTKLQAQIKQIDTKLQVIISSFNPCLLIMMQRLAPQLTYALLLDQHSYLPNWELTVQFL